MTRGEWGVPASMIDSFWTTEFTDSDEDLWYRQLKDFHVDDVIAGIDALTENGDQKFRPSLPELKAAIRRMRTPDAPDFYTAKRWTAKALVWRPRRSEQAARGYFHGDMPQKEIDKLALQRLYERHPMVAGWVATYGITRLRQEPVDDPDEGQWILKRWKESYEDYIGYERSADEVHRAINGPARAGLRQLDPLASLGLGKPELVEGGE